LEAVATFYESDRRCVGAATGAGENGVGESKRFSMVQIWSTIANSEQHQANVFFFCAEDATSQRPTNVQHSEFLGPSATPLLTPVGRCWARPTSRSKNGDRQKARFQEKYFRLIKEAGFSHIRINLHPFRDKRLGADHKLRADWLETLDWALKHAWETGWR
jgi:hypothetical protein